MLRELQQGERRRDAELRRLLAELGSAIDALIERQRGELARLGAALAAAGEGPITPGLDAGMIELHRSTLGLIDSLPEDDREVARVGELLGAAATAQAAAAAELRALDGVSADAQERVSLQRLREAREEAARREEEARQREDERAREELRAAYEEALSAQKALSERTTPLVGRALSRRERQEAAAIAQEQEALGASLAALREQTEGLADSAIASFAHERLDEASGRAARTLNAADAGAGRRAQATVERVLEALIAALTDPPEQQPEFRDNPEGGEQGQQGGGQQQQQQRPFPPARELALLRLFQQEAAARTRELADAQAPASTELDEVAALQRSIHERAAELLRALQDQGGGPAPEGEGGDAPAPRPSPGEPGAPPTNEGSPQ
jgi:hypothetical protein